MSDKRVPLIAGNWKMYKTVSEAVTFIKELLDNVDQSYVIDDAQDRRDVLICAPYVSLVSLCNETKNTWIKIGAENVHPEKEGAFTGEISAEMIEAVGCSHVIIGHSERRHVFNEDDEFINKKVKKVVSTKLTPILCVGELIEEREAGTTEQVVEKQIIAGLKDLSKEEISKVVIAYEPVWAIGTGKTATPDDAEAVQKYIRGLIAKTFDDKLARNLRILYGGSVKPENVDGLMAQPDIDGALIGGASLKVESFKRLIEFVRQ